jgi:hypothetical protein
MKTAQLNNRTKGEKSRPVDEKRPIWSPCLAGSRCRITHTPAKKCDIFAKLWSKYDIAECARVCERGMGVGWRSVYTEHEIWPHDTKFGRMTKKLVARQKKWSHDKKIGRTTQNSVVRQNNWSHDTKIGRTLDWANFCLLGVCLL